MTLFGEFLGLSASISFLHNIYHWVSQPPNPTGVLASCEWTKALGLWVYVSQCRKVPWVSYWCSWCHQLSQLCSRIVTLSVDFKAWKVNPQLSTPFCWRNLGKQMRLKWGGQHVQRACKHQFPGRGERDGINESPSTYQEERKFQQNGGHLIIPKTSIARGSSFISDITKAQKGTHMSEKLPGWSICPKG